MQFPISSVTTNRSTLLLHDYGGYAFPAQLALELALRHYEVHHVYCGSNPATPIGLDLPEPVPANFRSSPVVLPTDISKTSFVRRAVQERHYGQKLASIIRHERPQIVTFANTPIETLSVAIKAAKQIRAKTVIWVQDLLGEAALRILPRKLGTIGKLAGQWYQRREAQLFATADYLIPITNEFSSFFDKAHIARSRWSVIHNWANVSSLPEVPKANSWANDHSLSSRFVFLYSGSLGFKYNPTTLLDLAFALRPHPSAIVVVNSDGPAAEWLKQQAESFGLREQLMVNSFQPVERLAEVYGAADVLVGLLDSDGGAYCVPSKVLSYLCAGKPLLLSMPTDNLAARIVSESGCGLVSAASQPVLFINNALRLLGDSGLRHQMGTNARNYAENHFNINFIADKFDRVFSSL